jgi:hypothetical protein
MRVVGFRSTRQRDSKLIKEISACCLAPMIAGAQRFRLRERY